MQLDDETVSPACVRNRWRRAFHANVGPRQAAIIHRHNWNRESLKACRPKSQASEGLCATTIGLDSLCELLVTKAETTNG